MNKELKNCPFCGRKANLYKVPTMQREYAFVVKCEYLDCVMCEGGTVRQTREQAIQAWNRRATNEQT